MAADDRAAVVSLYKEFGPTIASVMHRILGDFHVEHVDRDDLDGLVMDACLALYDCAGAWRPDGGAQPWTWADKRLRQVAATFIGLHTDVLDDERAERLAAEETESTLEDPDELAILDTIAATGDRARLLRDAFGLVASPRNQAITLEVKVQAVMGDPSPAVTVARRRDMKPDAVRQVVKRTLDGLRALAASDPTYAPLADLPFLA
jgi:hypothetical protein